MMQRARGFALADALLAMLALGLTLSPMLLLQLQSLKDLQQSGLHSRVLLLAVSLVEELRRQPDAQRVDTLLLNGQRQLQVLCGKGAQTLRLVALRHEPGGRAQGRELQIRWRDPEAQALDLLVPP